MANKITESCGVNRSDLLDEHSCLVPVDEDLRAK